MPATDPQLSAGHSVQAPTESSRLLSSAQSTQDPDAPEPEVSPFNFRIILATLWFGTFLAAADSTIVSTLLANIASDLNALDSVSWVATAYLIAYSAFQPLYGKLSDIYGRQRVLQISTLAFGAGCQVCAMAGSMKFLVVGRLLNGVGAGGMMSMSVITVSDFVPGRSRGVYQGFGNLVFAAGASLGGILGGKAQAYKGWRFAFAVQVPLSLLSIVIVSINMRHVKKPPAHLQSFDRIVFVGSWSLASAISLLMLGATLGGNQYRWLSVPIVGSFVLAVILLAVFVYWETNKAKEPVLPVPLLRNRTVFGNCINLFFSSGSVYALMFYVPIYLFAVLDYTPTTISHRLLANFVGGSFGAIAAGYLIRASGKYYKLGLFATGGLALSAMLWLSLPLLPSSCTDTWWWQASAYGIMGLSYFSILTVTLCSMIATIPEQQSIGTSAQYTFRGSGSSLLLAAAGVIFSNVLKLELKKNITGKHAASVIHRVSRSVEAIRELPIEYQGPVIQAYKIAGAAVFGVVVVWSTISFIAAATVEETVLENK